MKPKNHLEFELIRSLRSSPQCLPDQLLCHIGDDCSVFDLSSTKRVVLSSDTLVEPTHFRTEWIHPRLLGRKAHLVNLSDLAAMGAQPLACLMNLTLPVNYTGVFFEELTAGFLDEGQRSGMPLVGGDLSRGDKVTISVTAIGVIRHGEPIYRSGALENDTIFLIGNLGLSAQGLRILKRGGIEDLHLSSTEEGLRARCRNDDEYRALVAHFLPKIHWEAAIWLQERALANAMIDVSDGLSSDLIHILEESGSAAELEVEALKSLGCSQDEFSLDTILHGGEDYALLLTVSAHQERQLLTSYPAHFPELRRIGRVIKGPSEAYLVQEGKRQLIPSKGFDHFR